MNRIDKSTRDFINKNMKNRDLHETIADINRVHGLIALPDDVQVTTPVIESIFRTIDSVFYNNNFVNFVNKHDVMKPDILYTTVTSGICKEPALLAATMYDSTDPEFPTHLFGFVTALKCLNDKVSADKMYYSGGYITSSRLKFVILMLLHESIHILEYIDSYVTTSQAEHSVFFYYLAYSKYAFISRLSTFLGKRQLYQLAFDDAERVELLKRLIGTIGERDVIDDYTVELNDFSHAKKTLLGYITHSKFRNPDISKSWENSKWQ
jgi:hypothetical protein